ncbi:Oxygen sensor protein DosP [Marinomonas spartinae]|uniref:Oxygen sensor protein DosP n=1 Tax=Marinomonas spartinae TaxID=1792290 RepID=A0A1A8TKD6_9GAMM|nr:GGDEF domain-containing phosphodiesterase [Marinomonas spartinae]SBS33119.1 Oxygen sensor protein DosP [Marinomonas spartinae]
MLIDFLKAFFLIEPERQHQHSKITFQQSALKILIVVTLLVFMFVEINSLLIPAFEGKAFFLTINSGYVAILIGLLVYCRRYTFTVSVLFLIVMMTTGILLITTTTNTNAIKYGLLSLYSLPLIARLFFNFRTTLSISIANIGSFYLVVHMSHSLEQINDDMLPEFTSFYFQLLTFATLNFGLPFAVSRMIYTLESNTTHLESLYRRLNRNNTLYEEIFEHTGTPTMLCNKAGKILKVNGLARQLLSNSESLQNKIENSQVQHWLTPTEERSERYFWHSNTRECSLKTNPNTLIEMHRVSLTNHGHYILHLQDISQIKALKQQLENSQQTNSRLTNFDVLTLLPNVKHFCQQVNNKLAFERAHYSGAMIIIRISQFKLLNKQYGKDNANRLILSFAKILKNKLSDQTFICRLRGVKFACFVPLGQTYLIKRNLSALIQSTLPDQIKMDGNLLNMDYQVGVSYYQTDGNSAEELLDRCEMALEYSSSAERISYYNNQLEDKLVEEHQLGLELSNAIKCNNIVLWLQPQVGRDGYICSFEALARWQKADGSFVSPMAFIYLAEKLGLLPTLAENLLRSLIPILSEWHKEKIYTPVAFNLAGQELMNDVFFAHLMSLSADHPWLGKMLELEITETSSVMTHPIVHKRLKALSQYGFIIAIDDFGTGLASLGQLIDIPAKILKIDRRFISPLPDDQRHLDIVKSTIQLAQSLNMKVIAEGIESKEQADTLIDLGCHIMQGYYFGKPAPMTEWTKDNHAKAKHLRLVR